MAFVLLDDQFVTLKVVGVDDAGNQVPAQLDAPAVWTSSDPTIVTAEPDPSDASGATAVVTATGQIGTVTVTVTGTAAGGAIPLNDAFDIEVATSPEVNFGIVASAPQHKP